MSRYVGRSRGRGANIAGWLLLLVASGTAAATSCTVVHGQGSSTGTTVTTTSETTSMTGTGGSGGSGGTGTGGAAPAITGRSIFESTVLDGVVSECGACHKLGGIADAPFLAAPDLYDSITSWPGVIISNPSLSVLLTHPASGSHGGGQAPNLTPGLRTKVEAWLQYEAENLPQVDAGSMPHIEPFKPFLKGAFNAVYLDPLGDDFANSSITFNAEELPASSATPSLLLLSNIQVHPIAGVELHVVHPLFTVYPTAAGAIPDVADSFSGFDSAFTLDGDPTFGTGTLILAHWEKDARLGIAFEKIEATKTGGTAATCKNVAKFQAEVVPQLAAMWPCASMCHAGGNIAAQQQMDLSNLAAMPPDDACAQVRARIDTMNPDNSQIFVVTDPTQAAIHLFKFAGNKNNHTSFKTAVKPWILSEQ